MNPDKILKNMRDLCSRLLNEEYQGYGSDLASDFEALDRWITDGGHLPNDWDEV